MDYSVEQHTEFEFELQPFIKNKYLWFEAGQGSTVQISMNHCKKFIDFYCCVVEKYWDL